MSKCKNDKCSCVNDNDNDNDNDNEDFDKNMLNFLESKLIDKEKPEPNILYSEQDPEDYIHISSVFDEIPDVKVGNVVSNSNKSYSITIDELKPIDIVSNKSNKKVELRKFDSGAIRDTNIGKLEYSGFIDPLVLKEFANYMNRHRNLPDGTLRGSDNWRGLFGDKHEDVCLDSMLRHVVDAWLVNKGYPEEARESLIEALCAIMFNAQAWLYKLILDKKKNEPEGL